jgi:glycosyltransferase involved in cell wall biosynthesis
MNRMFDLGVVVPLYNKADSVARTVEALLEQSVKPARIVVVDDGSTDASADQLRRFARHITLRSQANAGPSAARNAGLAELHTEWVAIADADNVWQPGRVEHLRDFLTAHSRIDWATGQYAAHLPEGRHETRPAWSEGDAALGYFEHVEQFYGLHCSETLVARRSLVNEVGGFDPQLRCYEITLMYLQLALRRPTMGFLARPTADVFLDTPTSLFAARRRQLGGLLDYAAALRKVQFDLAPTPPFVHRLIADAVDECLYFAQQEGQYELMRRILREYGPWLRRGVRWKAQLRCGFARLRQAG